MLGAIIAWSVRNRPLVVFLAAIVAAIGAWSLSRLPIDAVPDITNVQVQINTRVAGLIPEDVERQVTFPIETAMAGIPGLEGTRSLSRNGFSQVTVTFGDEVDLMIARQQVAERLATAREELPAAAEPRLGPIATGLGEVLMYSLEFTHPDGGGAAIASAEEPGWHGDGRYRTPDGRELSGADQLATYLRTLQDWVVAPQLRGVPGVADVDTIGGYRQQYVVLPDPAQLAARDLTMQQVAEAVERANSAAGGGYVERFGEEYVVRSDHRLRTLDGISRVVVGYRNGAAVRVRDVARVEIGHEDRVGSATCAGRECVLGTVLMLVGGNSRDVAAAAATRLTSISRTLPADVQLVARLNRQDLVDAVIATVQRNLVEGAALVLVILFALLGNLRAALIAATAIPISLLLAAIGMKRLGITGNLMSLGAIDFGIIIDTAVILAENGLRRIAERQHALGRRLAVDESLGEVIAASRQMIRPAVFGQAIIVIVYVPILLLTGIEGKMFRPMAQTVILALVGASVCSLTLIPALVALLLRGDVREPKLGITAAARRMYAPLLAWSLQRRAIVVAVCLAMIAGAGWIFSRLGAEFIPTLDEGAIGFEATRMPSIGVEQVTVMQRRVESAILRVPEVSAAFARTGTAELAFDPMPWNTSDVVVTMKPRSQWPDPKADAHELRDRVERAVAAELGTEAEFSQPIQQRFNELIAGVRADVAVKLFGDDLAALMPVADRIAATLRATPGADDVRVEQVGGSSALALSTKDDVMDRLGIDVPSVQSALTSATAGASAGVVFEGDRRFDLVVRLAESLRNDPDAIATVPVALPNASHGDQVLRAHAARGTVPLGVVSDLVVRDDTNQISREDGKRRIVVQCNVRDRDLTGFIADARHRIDDAVRLPTGTWLTWGGQFEHYQLARERLLIVVPLCFALIFALLYGAFGSMRLAVLVFGGVPFALVGGVVALAIRGMPFSISAAIGFIALSGVAVLNGLVLVSSITELRAAGTPLMPAITDGALSRLRPVLTTALVASLGFVPMALSHGQGAEVQKPLATVVIGGIVSSTLLTLAVLPALFRFAYRERSP